MEEEEDGGKMRGKGCGILFCEEGKEVCREELKGMRDRWDMDKGQGREYIDMEKVREG